MTLMADFANQSCVVQKRATGAKAVSLEHSRYKPISSENFVAVGGEGMAPHEAALREKTLRHSLPSSYLPTHNDCRVAMVACEEVAPLAVYKASLPRVEFFSH
jgi:hypothetical protein